MSMPMSVHMSVNMSVHMSMHMSIHMPVFMSIRTPLRMSIHMSTPQAFANLTLLKKGEDARPPHVTHRKGTEDDRRLTRNQKMKIKEQRHKSLAADAAAKKRCG